MEMNGESANIFKPSEEMRDLRLLEALEKNPIISQRALSNKFGIALGVTNACLKRMVRKGWIRIRDLNRRKIHYSSLKKIIGQRFLEMQNAGVRRIVFYGISDEMEVAYITLQGVNLKLVGIVEDDEKVIPEIIFGFEIEPVSRVQEFKPDCVLITSLIERDQKNRRLREILDSNLVSVKDICFP
jgi:DNA-binding MarR family transcriptional regulator